VKRTPDFEFPPEQDQALKRARRLEWLTIVYLASVIVGMYLVQGTSQVMKTAWIEDMLSLIPPIVFLAASRLATRPPSQRFAYGFHRVVSIAFLCASLALLTMGLWLLYEAVASLAQAQRPTIGGVTLFGRTFWLGWLMLPVLVWSVVPAMLLGRAKLPLASTMHDKVLHADASMNKADWMTGLAAMVGVLGIGYGFWWADAVAAAFVSADIAWDGLRHLREVVADLMDERPRTVDRSEVDPLPERLEEYLRQLSWVQDARVRLREEGHVFYGEGFVIVEQEAGLVQNLQQATAACCNMDWRLHDFVLTPVEGWETDEQTG
jgi:cation diffusion facilitator family transporter